MTTTIPAAIAAIRQDAAATLSDLYAARCAVASLLGAPLPEAPSLGGTVREINDTLAAAISDTASAFHALRVSVAEFVAAPTQPAAPPVPPATRPATTPATEPRRPTPAPTPKKASGKKKAEKKKPKPAPAAERRVDKTPADYPDADYYDEPTMPTASDIVAHRAAEEFAAGMDETPDPEPTPPVLAAEERANSVSNENAGPVRYLAAESDAERAAEEAELADLAAQACGGETAVDDDAPAKEHEVTCVVGDGGSLVAVEDSRPVGSFNRIANEARKAGAARRERNGVACALPQDGVGLLPGVEDSDTGRRGGRDARRR